MILLEQEFFALFEGSVDEGDKLGASTLSWLHELAGRYFCETHAYAYLREWKPI
ncbi:hypothetical protein COLO4_10026 [Corchorus olitorius]|uniref:Uncharacterized protein n=1 Tax=Corchorus olitorius TaxID=93759 RepID=A0A1R3KAB2_9ROSI|nr:hypothetical protein COLO4_10026 [Corchorus olitorius]